MPSPSHIPLILCISCQLLGLTLLWLLPSAHVYCCNIYLDPGAADGFVIRLIFFFPKEGPACVHPDRRWRGEGRARRGWKEPLMEEYDSPPMPAFLPGFVYSGLAAEMHGLLVISLLTPNKVNY